MIRISSRTVMVSMALLAGTVFCYGCSHHELIVSGQSGALSDYSLMKVVIGETSEEDLGGILGEPTVYYHNLEYDGRKYWMYSASVAIRTTSLMSAKQRNVGRQVWFRVAEGVVREIIQTDGSTHPDLRGYLSSHDSELKPHTRKL